MKFWLSFIKVITKRALAFSLTVAIGIAAFYFNEPAILEPETYILKAEIFGINKADCSRPNPLILLIEIDESRNITLNKQEMGNMKDTEFFEQELEYIFIQRKDNQVYYPHTEEVYKQVVIRFSDSVKYGDAVKLIESAEKVGANSIILDVDKNYCRGGGGGCGNGGLNKAKRHKSSYKKARRKL